MGVEKVLEGELVVLCVCLKRRVPTREDVSVSIALPVDARAPVVVRAPA